MIARAGMTRRGPLRRARSASARIVARSSGMRGVTTLAFALSVPALLAVAPAPAIPEPPFPIPAAPPAASPAAPAAPPASAPAAPLSADEVKALVREAQRVQRADAAAWAGYRFRRSVRSERLAEDGTVGQTSLMTFDIAPLAPATFDERLISIDGRDPTPGEVDENRGAARFTRHYRTLVAGTDDPDMEGGYSLATLLRLAAYHYVGREDIDGLATHRLDFEPDATAAAGGGIAARIAQAMSGSLWLTVDGLHLVRARAATARPVSLFLGLSRVRSLEVGLEAVETGAGDYLPREVTIVTHARVLFASVHRRQVFTYSDYTAADVITP
jgi:hypothetical protein